MREYKSKFFKSDSELFNHANAHSHQLACLIKPGFKKKWK